MNTKVAVAVAAVALGLGLTLGITIGNSGHHPPPVAAERDCPDYGRRLYQIESTLSSMTSTLRDIKSDVGYCE